MRIDRTRIAAAAATAALVVSTAGVGAVLAAEPTEGTTAAESGAETTGIEADGVGGHADPDGVNVDHQFEGNE
jgi:hypothetical protein